MRIYGLQKLTLIDFPGRVACTVFTGGCNFRCPFCHNASLVLNPRREDVMDEESFFSYLEKRKGVLDGVCVSGGEPLMQTGIEDFIDRIKAGGLSVKLDTNGSYPEKLKYLCENGLVDYVAMDIKNSPGSYAATVGLPAFDLSAVSKSVDYLLHGNQPYEFRTTVVRQLHSLRDFEEIGQWLKGAGDYYLQTFVDSGDIICDGLSAYTKEEMSVFRDILAKTVTNVALREI